MIPQCLELIDHIISSLMQICISKLTIIGSDNDLSLGRRQAIIWTNARILLIGPLRTNFNETSIEIHTFSFKKIYLKLLSAKWRPFCPGLNMLMLPAFHITWALQWCYKGMHMYIHIQHFNPAITSDPSFHCGEFHVNIGRLQQWLLTALVLLDDINHIPIQLMGSPPQWL